MSFLFQNESLPKNHMIKSLLNLFLVSFSRNRQSKTCPEQGRRIKNQKWIRIVAIGVAFAMCGAVAQAQQPKKVPRIGYLTSRAPASDSTRSEAIWLALRERGYIEGQNIAIEYRYAEGKLDRLPELAAELVRLKVDIIVVAGGNILVRAAKNATKTIPIVMAGGSDPSRQAWLKALPVPARTESND